MEFVITSINSVDRAQVISFISQNWGSQMIVSKDKIHDTAELPGFVCRRENKIIGLITFCITGNECEIVTLDSKVNNMGLGSLLLSRVIEETMSLGCKRAWLTTTNDNLYAIRFYQKRGFEWVGFRKNAVIQSRLLKPEIPESGYDNIPIRHEIEFELLLENHSNIK